MRSTTMPLAGVIWRVGCHEQAGNQKGRTYHADRESMEKLKCLAAEDRSDVPDILVRSRATTLARCVLVGIWRSLVFAGEPQRR